MAVMWLHLLVMTLSALIRDLVGRPGMDLSPKLVLLLGNFKEQNRIVY